MANRIKIRPAARSGFTLIELLVVISILVILMSLGSVSVMYALAAARTSASQSTINQIDQAVKMYYQEHKKYPSPGNTNLNIARALVGYADEGTYTNGSFSGGDGKDGDGYRLVKRGKVYGPWGGAESIDYVDQVEIDGTTHSDIRMFVDAFGNIIWYFRYNDNNSSGRGDDYFDGSYHDVTVLDGSVEHDNPAAESNEGDWNNAAAKDVFLYASKGKETGDDIELYRNDFIIISTGEDKKWSTINNEDTGDEDRYDPAGDDVTNFSAKD